MSIRIEEPNSTKRIIFLFLLFLVFPDFLFYTLGIDNFSISTIISIILLFVFLRAKNTCKDNLLIIVVLFILLCFNCLLSMLFNIEQVLSFKIVLSMYSILIMAYVSSCYAQTLWLCSEEILKRSVFYLFAFLCLIGIISILLQKTEIIHDKSMILFPETISICIGFHTYLFILFILYKGGGVLLLYILSLGIALGIQNLTMLVGIVISVFVMKKITIRQTIVIFLGAWIFSMILSDLDISYYTSRLDFKNTTNLSVLVYLSGIERAFLNFITSYGLGIGFQQMGVNGEVGVYQQILADLDAPMLNIYDGSFISSKLISEFGFIGAIMCIFYLFIFFRFYLRFKKNKRYPPQYILAYSFYMCFFIPLFIRGAGYINPYVFMLFSSIFLCKYHAKIILMKSNVKMAI
ncbi:membrane protein [Escherichia coli]|uniref:Membrane protein n=2 Tax=Escherichia coli TaxID=562 RepID=A0A377CD30_ECOLX|nr:membrane protein [Escherichia coli]